jgi:hypothetical protein
MERPLQVVLNLALKAGAGVTEEFGVLKAVLTTHFCLEAGETEAGVLLAVGIIKTVPSTRLCLCAAGEIELALADDAMTARQEIDIWLLQGRETYF